MEAQRKQQAKLKNQKTYLRTKKLTISKRVNYDSYLHMVAFRHNMLVYRHRSTQPHAQNSNETII